MNVIALRRHARILQALTAALTLALGFVASSWAATPLELPRIGESGGEHHPGKMIWADLVTPDLGVAERFYGALFGWTFQLVGTGTADYAVALADGHPVGGLLQRPVPAGEQRQPAWLTFIAVRDVDAARRAAMSHGASSVSAPKSYAGRGRQAVLSDPDGAVFAVLASSSGDPADFLPSRGEWIWSALLAGHPAQSAAFYQTVFGYDVFEAPSDDGADHLILSSDEYARASVNALPGGSARRHPHWLNFIRVADAARSAGEAVALGGRILVEPHVDHHGGHSAVIADPSGAPIGIMEWTDAHIEAEPAGKPK